MTVAREQVVLKLVHPKGRVELHKSPVTAAEVMRRNPRHCVTRPDVFDYPWIVVSPQSVLKPGNVYFIVPNHTLRRLLEANAQERPKGGLYVEEVDSIYDQFHDNKVSSADELARFRQLVRKRSPHTLSPNNKIIKKPSPLNPKVNHVTKSIQDTQKVDHCLVSNVATTKKSVRVHETHTFERSGEERGFYRETVSKLEPVISKSSDRPPKTQKPSPLNSKPHPITKRLQNTQSSPLEAQNMSLAQEKPNPRPIYDNTTIKNDSPVHETHTFLGSREARPESMTSQPHGRSIKTHPLDVVTISPKIDSDHHITNLKSCLKKHKDTEDRERRCCQRVRFQIPVEGSKGLGLRFRVFHFQRVDTP